MRDKTKHRGLRYVYEENSWKKKPTNFYDPFFHLSVLLAFPVLSANLNTAEVKITHRNLEKYRDVNRWLAIVLFVSVISVKGVGEASMLVFSVVLIGMTIASGISWYAISIGRVRSNLFEAAINLTKWMLVAFIAPIVVLAVLASKSGNDTLAILLAGFGVLMLFVAIQYDLLDSLSGDFEEAYSNSPFDQKNRQEENDDKS